MLELASEIERSDPGGWFELRASGYRLLAYERSGDPVRADVALRELEQKARAVNKVDQRLLHHLRGKLALHRGDPETAVSEIGAAADLLPARGIVFGQIQPRHVAIWFDLGQAHLAQGNEVDALRWFDRAARSGSERLACPLEWVRSLYWAGETQERLGSEPGARGYREFLRYRGESGLDQELVQRAEARLVSVGRADE